MDASGHAHAGLSSAFVERVDALLPLPGDALDLGTGTGRAALHLAPRVRRVVGVDIDAGAIAAARDAAQRLGILNAEFFVGDAETLDLVALNRGRPYEIIVAHLFLSLPLLTKAHGALAAGGDLVVYGLARANWQEAGGSRFNLAAEDVESELRRLGFDVREVRLEETVREFASTEDAKAFLKDRRLWMTWSKDGRWERWKSTFRRGPRRLSESRVLGWARRPA